MPELPEVQTVINSIVPQAVGAKITRVEAPLPGFVQPSGTPLATLLTGRVIEQIYRRGKRIVFTLDSGKQFLIHLGMTGRLTVQQADRPRARHTHLVLALQRSSGTDSDRELRLCDPRRFGEVRWLGEDPCDEGLGTDALVITARELQALLSRSHRPIKSFLLDQAAVAGLGNIYVDESLFAAGIHPLTLTDTLKPEQIARLATAIKRVLRKAIHHRGSSIRDYVDGEGGKGSFQKLHNVYGREGLPCRKCKTQIIRIVLSGRSTCFCPRCQDRPA